MCAIANAFSATQLLTLNNFICQIRAQIGPFLFALFFKKFLRSYVRSKEKQHLILSKQAARYTIRVFFLYLILGKICTDYRCLFTAQTVIDEVIKCGYGELVDYLCSKVINDEEVAVKISIDM